MLVLVTNDDGIASEGLDALAEAARDLGRVIVVAPDREKSSCSHQLTLHDPLRIREVGPDRYTVDGSPADCVNVAVHGLFQGKRPDLVLSGINRGGNLGEDVIYSGTVAAAEEAAILQIPSLAVSVEARSDFRYDAAAQHAVRFSRRLVENGLTEGLYFSMNVPNLPPDEIRGVRITRLGTRIYCDALEERIDPRGARYYWIGGAECGMQATPGSDMEAVTAGYVSITPLRLDRTDEQAIRDLAKSYGEAD